MKLVISDAHQGLRNAIAYVFDAPWQRCTVHYLRDMLGHVGKAQQLLIATAICQLFNADSGQEARERRGEVADRLRGPAPEVTRLFEDAGPDLPAFYASHAITGPSFARRTRLSG